MAVPIIAVMPLAREQFNAEVKVATCNLNNWAMATWLRSTC